MKSGTAKKRKYIPVKDVHSKLPPESDRALLAFHALTGCDTTSYFTGHSKTTAYWIFKEHHNLINSIGDGTLTDDKVKRAERFICKLYKVPDSVEDADEARFVLFSKANSPEVLPPTSDALKFHILRAHYQALIWKMAYIPNPTIPAPDQYGWKREQNSVIPILMSRNAIPQECLELVSCQCQKGCQTMRCKCRKARLQCTGACKCSDLHEDSPCINRNWMYYGQRMYSLLQCSQYHVLKSLVGYEIYKMWNLLFKYIWDTPYRTKRIFWGLFYT